MSITLSALQKQRRDTAANWTGANPTLLAGEIGIESDTNKIKIGDGSTAWTSLAYRPWSQVSAYPLVNADIAAAAAIAYSKLATLTSGNVVLGSSANVATSTAVTGDVTISNTGVTAIASGVIVNADINASAAIVDTKLATIATALKVSNSATTATNANTASAIVARDASGNFTAGTITAAVTGAASSNVLKAGDTMTGALVHPLGTAALPSVAFTGDLNTGIFSPGADQVAISTNGTGKLFVDASGNVGVATAVPAARFHVAGLMRVGANDASTAELEIGAGATGDRSAIVDMVGDTTYTDFGLRLARSAGENGVSVLHHRGTGELRFTVQEAGFALVRTSNLERLRITSAGNVGIGTSTPGSRLTVAQSAGQLLELNNLSAAADNRSWVFAVAATSLDLACRTDAGAGGGNVFRFNRSAQQLNSFQGFKDGAAWFHVDNSTARVGIGTTSPGKTLTVKGSARIQDADSFAGLNIQNDNDSSVATTTSFLDVSNNLGIPDGHIFFQHLTTGGSNAVIATTPAGDRAVDRRVARLNISFAGTTSLSSATSTPPFIANIGASEVARIDSSGRLLVGIIASPAHQLQVSTDSAGKPSTNTWTIVSDERIKEEIELADLDLCYAAVKTIPLKRFKWKDEVYTEEQVRDRRKLGWIAQDVEAVFPKAVGTYEFKYNQVFEETIIPAVEEELDNEGNVTTPAQPERIEKGDLISEDVIEDCRDLNSDQLYAAMYGAIQKLMIKVEALETEITSLKAIG